MTTIVTKFCVAPNHSELKYDRFCVTLKLETCVVEYDVIVSAAQLPVTWCQLNYGPLSEVEHKQFVVWSENGVTGRELAVTAHAQFIPLLRTVQAQHGNQTALSLVTHQQVSVHVAQRHLENRKIYCDSDYGRFANLMLLRIHAILP